MNEIVKNIDSKIQAYEEELVFYRKKQEEYADKPFGHYAKKMVDDMVDYFERLIAFYKAELEKEVKR